MPFRIIDNKKVEITEDEWSLYQKIVKSYNSITNKGEDLFIDLFEVDENGIIIFLKPPSKRQTSFEVFLFLMALQQQQHIRIMYTHVSDICSQMKTKMQELDAKLSQFDKDK
jgi:hypothetical protein